MHFLEGRSVLNLKFSFLLAFIFPFRVYRCSFAVSVPAHIAIFCGSAWGRGGSRSSSLAVGQAVATTQGSTWQIIHLFSTSALKQAVAWL